MSSLQLKELSHPEGEVLKIEVGKTLDLETQGTVLLPPIPTSKMPSGSVLQVVDASLEDVLAVAGTTFVDALTLVITPSSPSSKILIQVTLNMAGNNRYSAAKIYRDSTQILKGSPSGLSTAVSFASPIGNLSETGDEYTLQVASFQGTDSPATTGAVTYKVKIGNTSDVNATTQLNKGFFSGDHDWMHYGISTITLMEIKG